MTRDHDDLFGDWSEGLYNWEGEQFQQNDLVMMPFLVTLLLIFGLIFFAAKKDSLWPAWFAVFGGGYATITYLQDKTGLLKPFSGNAPRYIIDDSNPLNITVEEIIKPFKGGMAYNVHLVLSVVILVLSLSILIPWFISVYRWFTVKKRHY